MTDDNKTKIRNDEIPCSKKPLPPLDGIEEVTETDLDNVAGGALGCASATFCPLTGGE
jgi:hypothetical protein